VLDYTQSGHARAVGGKAKCVSVTEGQALGILGDATDSVHHVRPVVYCRQAVRIPPR